MTTLAACAAIALTLLSALTANTAAAQLMTTCVENSPERRGEIGCSIIQRGCSPTASRSPCLAHRSL